MRLLTHFYSCWAMTFSSQRDQALEREASCSSLSGTRVISPVARKKKQVRLRNWINIFMVGSSCIGPCLILFFISTPVKCPSLSFHTWFQRSCKGGDGNFPAALILTPQDPALHRDRSHPPRTAARRDAGSDSWIFQHNALALRHRVTAVLYNTTPLWFLLLTTR